MRRMHQSWLHVVVGIALAVGVAVVLQGPTLAAAADAPAGPPDDGKLRIIVFGAHPDDCEIRAGGAAIISRVYPM